MHPLNPHKFGTAGLLVSYYNGTAVTKGYITKQFSLNKFEVTDGSNPKVVTLAPTTAIATDLVSNPTYFTIQVYPYSSASGATFTAHYGVDSATKVNAGTGYTANDVLTLSSTGSATITVNTVTGGAVTTFTVSAIGTVTSLPTNPVGVTGGTGTGATFNLKWKLLSGTSGVTSSGGTGYAVNDALIFNGIVATTKPAAHISTATAGAATAVTVDTVGAGITTAATSISVVGPIEYVHKIYSQKLLTTAGNVYKWDFGSSVEQSAILLGYY